MQNDLPPDPRPEDAPAIDLPVPPIVGLTGVVVGTAASLLVFPDNPLTPGALRLSGIFMAVGFLAMPVACAVARLRSVLRAENLFMLGIVYWLILDMIVGGADMTQVTPAGLQYALIGIGLFAGSFWFSCLVPSQHLPGFLRRLACMELPPEHTFNAMVIFFALGIFNFAYACGFDVTLMFTSLLSGRFSAPWSRGFTGGWEAFREHLQYFGYILPTLTTVLALQRRWSHPQTLMALMLSAIMLVFLAHGVGGGLLASPLAPRSCCGSSHQLNCAPGTSLSEQGLW